MKGGHYTENRNKNYRQRNSDFCFPLSQLGKKKCEKLEKN